MLAPKDRILDYWRAEPRHAIECLLPKEGLLLAAFVHPLSRAIAERLVRPNGIALA
jgi:hypothetical protein